MRKTQTTGNVGEHLACARLESLGWETTLARVNASRVDVFAQNSASGLTAAFQVKSRLASRSASFVTKGLGYGGPGSNEWVILVAITDDAAAEEFHVLPLDVAGATNSALISAKEITNGYLRMSPQEFEVDGQRYKDNWSLLDKPSWEHPLYVAGWVKANEKAVRADWPKGRGRFPGLKVRKPS